jgi:cobalamin biosynthesis protein CobW
VQTCTEEDIVELTNGCICCTVADDFLPAMARLIDRDRRLDHIVIETSGLALPQPLIDAFNWPQVRLRVTVDGVVTVVDARAVADGRFAEDEEKIAAARSADPSLGHDDPLSELFEDQITAADLVVLNKCDLLEPGEIGQVEGELSARSRRQVRTVRASGALPADVLLGLGAASELDLANRKSQHEMETETGAPHDHDEFASFVADLGQIGDVAAFVEGLRDVIEAHDILRLKGICAVKGKPMRLVVQAVGRRVERHFDRDWRNDEEQATRLVVIGQAGLDRAAIERRLRQLAR